MTKEEIEKEVKILGEHKLEIKNKEEIAVIQKIIDIYYDQASDLIFLLDIVYSYGVMQGKRAERARRKKKPMTNEKQRLYQVVLSLDNEDEYIPFFRGMIEAHLEHYKGNR